MAAGEDALAVLRSIDATLKAMLALAQQRTAQARAARPKAVASAHDLDSKYGNPVLKFRPRDWTGPSFKNVPFSECPAELLDLVADSLDYFAQQADLKDERTEKGKPVSDFKRADAARARGWAHRIRQGHQAPNGNNGHQSAPDEWSQGDGW